MLRMCNIEIQTANKVLYVSSKIGVTTYCFTALGGKEQGIIVACVSVLSDFGKKVFFKCWLNILWGYKVYIIL